jgi:hypothetical protein
VIVAVVCGVSLFSLVGLDVFMMYCRGCRSEEQKLRLFTVLVINTNEWLVDCLVGFVSIVFLGGWMGGLREKGGTEPYIGVAV